MDRPEAQLTALLLALPMGKTLWMKTRGVSMRPLLRTHDSVKVLRCGQLELQKGDIAILKSPNGSLRAHLVAKTEPLLTTTFWGKPDEAGLEVVGKAIAFKRGRMNVHMGMGRRRLLFLASRVYTLAVHLRHQAAQSRLGRWLVSSRTQKIRNAVWGDLQLRELTLEDEALLAAWLPIHVSPDAEALKALLPPSGKTVVVIARGRIRAIASRNHNDLWHLQVTPWARGLGWEDRMKQALGFQGIDLPLRKGHKQSP